jgi:sulfatase modifying factor 1
MAIQRQEFNDNQKSALVQLMLTGGLSLEQACALYDLSTDQLKDWVNVFRRAVRQALDHQLRDTLSVQGLELDGLAPPEFSGSLGDIGIDDLLQTIQMGRKDAHITITHSGEASEIWCRGGHVVDARSGSLEGEKAFYRMLAIERGEIVADFAPNDHARRIALSTPRLLLEAASSTGLRARSMHRIGDPTLVFTVTDDLTVARSASLEPDELDVLSLFDGVRSVEEVMLLSGLAHDRTLEIVAHFRERHLLVKSTAPTGLVPELEGAAPSGPITMSYRPFVASSSPEPAPLSPWWLACGAALCSSLGAVAAIAYASAESAPAPPLGEPQPSISANPEHDKAMPAASASVPAPVSSAGPPTPALRGCPKHMAWIEAGAFMMGSDSSRPAFSLAHPAHRVNVSRFCIDTREVTVRQYDACADAGACTPAHQTAHFAAEAAEGGESPASVTMHGVLCNAGKTGREDHPINCISHVQAADYCRARGARLPSEAEWEFAARGPGSRSFPWGETKPTRAHINACGLECRLWHMRRGLEAEVQGLMYPASDRFAGTAPVGSFPLGATPDGVEDLIGNVFEWTAEGLYEYGAGQSTNPHGPSDGDSFVIRGGNFNSGIQEYADPALRFAMHRESYSHGVGFRCAADAIRSASDDPGSFAQTREAAPLRPVERGLELDARDGG